MKRWISLIGLLAVSFSSASQVLTYRSNDPFVFCRYGIKDPDRCWWPVPSYVGQFMLNPLCDIPNPYGKTWTNDDTVSFGEYLAVCPIARDSGTWKGSGDGTETPKRH